MNFLSCNQKNSQQMFKITALNLIDRIKNIEQYAIQVSKIAYQDDTRLLSLENLINNQDNLIQDTNSIFCMQSKIKQFKEVIQVILKMVNEYNNITINFQELQTEQKQILSKISVNKEIFKRCKVLFSQIQKYFFNSQTLIPTLKKYINADFIY